MAARVAADEGSPELNQGEVDVVGGASPTVAEDEGTLELSQGEESSAAASRVRPDRPSRVDLPAFVSVSGDHLQDQDGRTHYRARPIASPSNHEALNRSAASGSTTAKRPISLPQVVISFRTSGNGCHVGLEPIYSGSQARTGPALELAYSPGGHARGRGAGTALPANPRHSRCSSGGGSALGGGISPRQGNPLRTWFLPVFATPRTKVKAGQNPPVDLSLVSARAESADISTTSQDLLEPQGTLAQAENR